MPVPLIAIGIGVAAASGVVTVSQTIATKQLQKTYKTAYAQAEISQNNLQDQAEEFNQRAEDYGQAKVLAAADLQRAVDFLKQAKLKHREFQVPATNLDMPAQIDRLEFQTEVLKTVMRTAGGGLTATGAAVAPAGIYAAVGLFGTASTGTAISSLSGAAAHSATMAWIGRAVTLGGAGMAAGSTALTAISLGLNIITLPLSVGAAFWSVKKGREIKEKVAAEMAKIAAAEKDMALQSATMDTVIRQMSIGKQAIQSAKNTLIHGLRDSDPERIEDAHAVYNLANLLSHAIDAEVITKSQAQILGIKLKNDDPTAEY